MNSSRIHSISQSLWEYTIPSLYYAQKSMNLYFWFSSAETYTISLYSSFFKTDRPPITGRVTDFRTVVNMLNQFQLPSRSHAIILFFFLFFSWCFFNIFSFLYISHMPVGQGERIYNLWRLALSILTWLESATDRSHRVLPFPGYKSEPQNVYSRISEFQLWHFGCR